MEHRRVTLRRRVPRSKVEGDAEQVLDGKMVIRVKEIRPFRGFTHKPEEGQKLATMSFTDTPLLKRVRKLPESV